VQLRYQAAILLGVPLLCQLGFAYLLVSNLQQLDEAATRESRAKQVIASCQEVRSCFAKYNMLIAVQRIDGAKLAQAQVPRLKAIAENSLERLREATRDDKESAAKVEDYCRTSTHLQNVFLDIMGAYGKRTDKPAFAEFISEPEALDDLATSLARAISDEDYLLDKYGKVEAQFQPKAFEERLRLRDSITTFAIVDTVIVLLLAVYFGRNTLNRLRKLMINISAFSSGKPEMVVVGGNDELGELDAEFRKMAEARVEAEQRQRSMYAMISHDLRSPLTSVGLSISYVEETGKDVLPEKALNKLHKVNSEIDRLMRLASSFLDLEQLDSGTLKLNRQPIEVNSLVQKSVDAVSGLAEAKGIQLIVSIADASNVVADQDRITQVLINLLSNAIKFSPENSKVTLAGCSHSERYELTVTDEAGGLKPEDHEKLFKRFSQLENTVSGGSGLGLYICKLLVEAHGGSIGARSTIGGTGFWFTLPTR